MAEEARKNNLSTEPYKGVRDFYPEDWAIQNHMWKVCRAVVERFGFEEYNASPLEPSELYKSKTSDEIVNEQTYTFTDRGEREVTLRPEMTPTVARLIAAKRKTLVFPVRWYSVGNMFRYERPQKGRLREHYQLNVDLFGIAGVDAETEMINIAYEIVRGFGIIDERFEIRINSRKVMNYIIGTLLGQSGEDAKKTAQLIDRRAKMKKEVFDAAISEHLGEKDRLLLTLLNSKNFEEFISRLPKHPELDAALHELRTLMEQLEKLGITNVVFDQTLMRGFDYYTGIVFEVFDTNPANPRSLFGGGRYDNLLDLFGVERVPTVGFAMGDVTMRDVLETYNLLPAFKAVTKLVICTLGGEHIDYAKDLAQKLRAKDVSVIVDYSGKKIGDQIKRADKQGIPFVVCVGEEEVKTGTLKLKNLKTGEETATPEEKISGLIKAAVSSPSPL